LNNEKLRAKGLWGIATSFFFVSRLRFVSPGHPRQLRGRQLCFASEKYLAFTRLWKIEVATSFFFVPQKNSSQ